MVLSVELSPEMKGVFDSIHTERSFEQYRDMLQISDEDLERWEKIIDLGSGTQQEFAKGYKENGFEGMVISVDPALGLPEDLDIVRYLPEEEDQRISGRSQAEKNTIAALAQELPIADRSVDAVLAYYSAPMYVDRSEEVGEVMSEITRVLESGGEARIYPISEGKINNYQIVKSWLEDHSDEYEYDFQEIGISDQQIDRLLKIRKKEIVK